MAVDGQDWRFATTQAPMRRRSRLNSFVFQNIPGRAGPQSLSFDIFLLIIDQLIQDAKDEETPALWCFSYDARVDTRFVLRDYAREHAAPETYDSHKCRFNSIHLPLEISRATRSLVHQHFIRLPMVAADFAQNLIVDAWVLPEIDRFRPQSTMGYGYPDCLNNIIFTNTLLLPPPQAVLVLNCICTIHLNTPGFFSSDSPRGVGSLLTLPNLKSIICNVVFGGVVEDDLNPRSPDIIEIPALLDSLTQWRDDNEQAFMTMWPAFEKKGVKMLGKCIFGNEQPILEVLRTPYGIRIRYLSPDARFSESSESQNEEN
ncbi:hypothetical protein K4K58_011210 [Colletotrichum sp. SAR11_239]|nr:hypothetical protein K4K58_011210 [Colletotrichum sp. SAR11_239]